MFPVNSSLHHGVSLLSAGSHRSGSPPSPILSETLRHPALHTGPLWFRCPAPALPSFALCSRSRAPVRPEAVFSGQGHFVAGVPYSGFPTRTTQDFSGSLPVHPTPMPCSKTPAESRCPRLWRPSRYCPRIQQNEGSGKHMISWLTHGLSVRCLRFTRSVTAAHARLASAWLARLCREGVEPSEPIRKVSVSTSHPPFQGLS